MIQAGNSSDGLSDKEKVDLLFKNYMNYTSTLPDQPFFTETILGNHTNIFGSSILSDDITEEPDFYQSITSSTTLNEYLNEFIIDDIWFQNKTNSDISGSFAVDTTGKVLRLEKIKLEYLGEKSSAFGCFDNSENNILKNLIPPNFSKYDGYNLELYGHYIGTTTKIQWLWVRKS